MSFVSSSVVPAATDTINVKKDKNNNYVMIVKVLNLAEAQKLASAKSTYIIWMDPTATHYGNQGR